MDGGYGRRSQMDLFFFYFLSSAFSLAMFLLFVSTLVSVETGLERRLLTAGLEAPSCSMSAPPIPTPPHKTHLTLTLSSSWNTRVDFASGNERKARSVFV